MRRPAEPVTQTAGGAVPLLALAIALAVLQPAGHAAHPSTEDLENLFTDDVLLPLAVGAASTALLFAMEPGGGDGLQGFIGSPGFTDFGRGYIGPVLSPVALTSVSLAGYCLGALARNDNISDAFSPYARGLLMTNLLAGGLKLATQRRRPDCSDHFSFPSAHSASSSFLAAFLWETEGWEIGLPAAAIAAIVGLSRIDTGAHYPSDVIAGATIGVAVGLAVAETELGEDDGDEPGGRGLMLHWSTDTGLGVRGGGFE